MDMQIAPPSIELHPLNPLRLRVSAGRHLTNVSGTAWVTLDGDLRDIILEAGESFAFERPGRAMVQALGGDARLVTEEGVEVEVPGTLAGLWQGLRRAIRIPGNLA